MYIDNIAYEKKFFNKPFYIYYRISKDKNSGILRKGFVEPTNIKNDIGKLYLLLDGTNKYYIDIIYKEIIREEKVVYLIKDFILYENKNGKYTKSKNNIVFKVSISFTLNYRKELSKRNSFNKKKQVAEKIMKEKFANLYIKVFCLHNNNVSYIDLVDAFFIGTKMNFKIDRKIFKSNNWSIDVKDFIRNIFNNYEYYNYFLFVFEMFDNFPTTLKSSQLMGIFRKIKIKLKEKYEEL